jgi:RNA polymerase sigma-70 factor (ECF subfamily)
MDTACELTKPFGTEGAAPARQRLDENLLESIAAGDRFAMQVFFQRHNVRVYRFLLRLTGNASVAEEIVGEVFLDVWRHAGTSAAKCQATTWLLAIAHDKAPKSAVKSRMFHARSQMAKLLAAPGLLRR